MKRVMGYLCAEYVPGFSGASRRDFPAGGRRSSAGASRPSWLWCRSTGLDGAVTPGESKDPNPAETLSVKQPALPEAARVG